ncbi:MAG: hypothetical protein IJP33_03495 [Firmicutes bacterium]|nr:hypothetical protein [Bacillota bacterium]
MASGAEHLKDQLLELKEENINLRISRRILMSLLAQERQEFERERKLREDEIRKLRNQNSRLLKRLWEQNKRIAQKQL